VPKYAENRNYPTFFFEVKGWISWVAPRSGNKISFLCDFYVQVGQIAGDHSLFAEEAFPTNGEDDVKSGTFHSTVQVTDCHELGVSNPTGYISAVLNWFGRSGAGNVKFTQKKVRIFGYL
jgi:hypothetical protein